MPLQPTYKCSQQNLYDLCKVAWNSVTEYLADFTTFSPMYIAALVTSRLGQIEDAEALPDEEQRIEQSRTLRVDLVNKAIEGRDLWQKLKRYIIKAYPKDQQEIKLNAAGQAHYAKAANEDWEANKRLLIDGETFISANSAALEAGLNMPPTFFTTFSTAKGEFAAIYEDYLETSQADEVETQNKITANNTLQANVMSMMLDGQEIFKNNEAVKKLFTYEQVLLTVAGPGTQGLKGTITNATTGLPVTAGEVVITGPTNKTVQINEDGHYNAPALTAGTTYTITLNITGYQPQAHTNLEVSTGIMRTINITLVPNP